MSRTDHCSKREQGQLSQFQIRLQDFVRKLESWLFKKTQKRMKKRQKHQLYLQDILTSPLTGCLPPPPPFDIGIRQNFFLASTTTTMLTRYHVPSTRLSSTPYHPLESNSFSSTTIETLTSTDASYDTVASELAEGRGSEESNVIPVVHLQQGTEHYVPVTSI